jgi:hypothetical protein
MRVIKSKSHIGLRYKIKITNALTIISVKPERKAVPGRYCLELGIELPPRVSVLRALAIYG